MNISKVLSNHLAPIIGDMIRDYQSRFIKRRSNLEGIITSKEVIHLCSRSRHDGYRLNLDFEKAHDNLS